ncbi:hypothetical protein TeGR_g12588, partial [Tetraparma gracilis]
MAFGSSPGVDCLPLSADPNSFLRDPSTSSIGDCALAQWDDFGVETAAVNAHNEDLLAAAKNATNATSGTEDLSVEAPADSYPAWRLPAIFGLLLIKIAAVLFGDALTKKKTGGGDMAAVAPFATQAYNAHQLAKFLDWRYLLIYGNLILGNFVIFGICLILPERFIGTSAMIGVDGLTDAFYIIFGIS